MKDNLSQNENLIVIGSGGHAAILVEILSLHKQNILAIVSPDKEHPREVFKGFFFYENDSDVLNYPPQTTFLVNGIGSIPGNVRRNILYHDFVNKGFSFYSVISPKAIISPFAKLGKGVQVMSGAIIQHGAVIGDNCIINTGAIVEHDCVIGANNHVAPGATLSGGVLTGLNVHIGTNSTIIQNIQIGDAAVVGAGAVITRNIEKNTIVYPAKVFSRGL
ncbi:acetyltransferase [Brenneria corticis]|uniref:Shikimate dehydrogenase n=1 Tax=Brenneria corticis TaxID=2173106 RepID=A0A2U1TK43_9GAMM|nr:acetyltransferase [Brenneria sp. CFCC 11842]PWC09729.1 shikimate dehydrogenase [Brenneria sp. CFCC 11842]